MYSYNSSSMSIVQQRKLAEAAEKALAPIPTLTGVLEHLHKHKPGYLNYGEEHWIDKRQLDEKYKGLRDKLTIHGFGDGAKRLQYLRSVMEKKWVNKMNSYKCIMTLLAEMSDRPCDNNELIVCTRMYSETPVEEEDEDSLLESDSEEALELERKRAEFKEHVLEDLRETRVEVLYSSDSDLSDWAVSDAEEDEAFHNVSTLRTLKSEMSFQTSPRLLRLPRLSLDFSFQVPTEAEKRRQSLKALEIRRQEAERHWNTEEINATNLLHQSIRHVEPIPLTFQPVISSLLLLHSRFGEYWEWKRRAAEPIKTQRLIIMENDIIHEILWQFTSPNTNKSIVFSPDWTIKPEIMISSLSQTILQSIVNKFGKVLSKLKNMKDFIANIERDCYGIGILGNTEETPPKLPQPQMYRVYAHSLTQVLTLVCSDVNEIERNLKKSRMEPIIGYPSPPVVPCTTLLQLDSQLRNCTQSIDILNSLHTQSTTSETDVPNWLKSVKLISCLEAHLGLEERPRIYGLVLYLFAKSLVCFLQELLGLVETVKWQNTDFLFQKNSEVKIEDAHFWENLITVQPFEEKLKSLNVMPFSCLKAILPKFLNVLKVLEMISQIQEGFKLMLHGAVPIYELIVEDFINQLLRTNPVQIQNNENSSVDSPEEPNYERHFMFLGLQNSMVANAFDYILDESPKKVKKHSPIDLHMFNSITEIPIESISVCLDRIFVQSLQPYLNSSQKAFKKLFLDYDVEGAMRVFREIIFSGREDFALDVIQLSGSITKEVQTENPQDIQRKRNAKYQMLLDKYYPDGRSLFDIRFILDVRADTNVRLDIKPKFPLNLILTPSAIKAYTLISHQLHRIRKSVWILTQLRFKECKAINGVSLNRMFVFRHCLLHFCSSFRNYLLIALFSRDITVLPNSDEYFDINEIRSAHEKDLHGSLCRLLSNQIVNSIVIRDIVRCSSYMEQYWATGISMPKMVKLESVLQKNWKTVADWGDRKYPSAMNELSHYFPPTPDIFG